MARRGSSRSGGVDIDVDEGLNPYAPGAEDDRNRWDPAGASRDHGALRLHYSLDAEELTDSMLRMIRREAGSLAYLRPVLFSSLTAGCLTFLVLAETVLATAPLYLPLLIGALTTLISVPLGHLQIWRRVRRQLRARAEARLSGRPELSCEVVFAEDRLHHRSEDLEIAYAWRILTDWRLDAVGLELSFGPHGFVLIPRRALADPQVEAQVTALVARTADGAVKTEG